MIPALILSSLIASCVDDAANSGSEFLARVEATELLDSGGNSFPRIKRNSDGEITTLLLNEMPLSAEDFEAIGRIETLTGLVLYHCPATDADLDRIGELPNLRSLNLTSTEITDASLVDLAAHYPELHYLCLGDVAVTPEAVDRLEAQFEASERDLAVGYSQRD